MRYELMHRTIPVAVIEIKDNYGYIHHIFPINDKLYIV